MSNKNVIWCGSALDPSGYGEATRGYLIGLDRLKDLNVKLVSKQFWAGDPPDLRQMWPTLSRMHRTNVDRREPYVFVQHLTPENYVLGIGACKYHIGMTTFETTQVPGHWQMPMRGMDELWTYSQWAKDTFIEQGIRRPISVIPHGVDIVRFRPGAGRLEEVRAAVGDSCYVIGANFDWTERKNPRALLTAYLNTFSADDDVVLLLKVYYQYPIERSRQYVMQYVEEVKQIVGKKKMPKIMILTDIMPADLVPKFYGTCDAYVLPSRGEGWGLTYSEAMASGLPTVAVNWSGNTEFMNDDNSLLCKDYKLVEIGRVEAGSQTQYVGHKWADVNVEELASKMRLLFDNRDLGKALGRKARTDMMQNFTWAKAAEKAKARLDAVTDATIP
jgi:glycosyltransferase involved in cell wall biosynthesis